VTEPSTLDIDTGIGISPDQLANIFSEYAQATPETFARFGGSGLGLENSYKLAEIFGSKIEVTSELNKGSYF
jgi:signal transduction histidine kinase